MVTAVGNEAHVVDLLADLIQLDYDAADAYHVAIDRLQNSQFSATLTSFREDHLRHAAELGSILSGLGHTPPEQRDIKSLLTRVKIVLGGLMGDTGVLEAMRSNEADTNTAYERAVAHSDLDDVTRGVLQQGLADERRHCQWVLHTLESVRSGR
jgi:bacterioferritin (cytochrome b1)